MRVGHGRRKADNLKWYEKLLVWLNPFSDLHIAIESVHTHLTDVKSTLHNDLEEAKDKVKLYKGLLLEVGDNVPDMVWAKDIDGKYLYANKAIKEGLLFHCRPEGKDDIELSLNAKAQFGDDNHTFGEICGNSDLVILDTLKPQRFLESGKVQGKMLYLEVFKAPLYIDGELVGVCGTGRDMTEYVEAFRANNCGSCAKMVDIFEKYEFKG